MTGADLKINAISLILFQIVSIGEFSVLDFLENPYLDENMKKQRYYVQKIGFWWQLTYLNYSFFAISDAEESEKCIFADNKRFRELNLLPEVLVNF